MKNSLTFILLLFVAGHYGMSAAEPVPAKTVKTIITGEYFSFNPLKHMAVYTGDVVVIDPQMDLLCDKLTIHFADKKKDSVKPKVSPAVVAPKKPTVAPMVGLGGNIDRIIAEGDVEIINKKDKTRAVGGHALYTAKTEVMVLTVDPKLFTKQGVLLAKMIEYNRVTGELSARQAVLENESKPKPPAKKPSGK